MTDAWNMTGGQVWVAPVGTEPSDPGWRKLGNIAPGSVGFAYGGSLSKRFMTGCTLTEPDIDPSELLKLYYGTDASTINNRGEARKEEKRMGVRKFEASVHRTKLTVEEDKAGSSKEGGVFIDLNDKAWGWFAKADVPLIAHALFEKSGWPDAKLEATSTSKSTWRATVGAETRGRKPIHSAADADDALSFIIANLAAYNAWVEGAAARLEAEVAAEAARVEAEERRAAENARKREHDALRTSAIALEALALYYGTDAVKSAGANNRGETRKEEKHMGVRKFKSMYGKSITVSDDGFGDACLEVAGSAGTILKHADVPLIAHALFEKSGWPGAEQDDDGDYLATVGTKTAFGMGIRDQSDADVTLARAIANLAAYNAWHEGTAEREAAEAAKKAEAEAARKREHDELRTSAIALEALALYNEANGTQYGSWSDTAMGFGHADDRVLHYIAKAEAARAARPAPKVGDRVRVSADAKTVMGGDVCFGEEVEGIVIENEVRHQRGDILVLTDDFNQYVDPKYVTVVATAEDLAAEKAKAERDAGIAAIAKAADVTPSTATFYYDSGLRAA